VTYNISIERQGEGEQISLTVDGTPIKGNIVPPPADARRKVTIKGILS
jgi:cellobiose phosphorylase